MLELIFATNNPHKVTEMQAAVGNDFKIITLFEAGINIEIAEPFDNLRENASVKSRTIYDITGKDCFSEDTGLEVRALAGAPGVRSARYAGEPPDPYRNMHKLLRELLNYEDRGARFLTIISLRIRGTEHFFEGSCEGRIVEVPRGEGGFGYDPIFQPDRASKTFGEMTLDEKGLFSHRKKACDRLNLYLQHLQATG